MDQIILFTSLSNQTITKANLGLYYSIKNYSTYKPYIYYSGDDKSSIWKIDGTLNIYSKPINSIKDTLVLLGGHMQSFIDLDSSNTIYYFHYGIELNKHEINLLPIIKTIVVCSNFAAYNISLQLTNIGYKPNLLVLTPTFSNQDPETPSIINALIYNYDNKFGYALNGLQKCSDYKKAWVCVYPPYIEAIRLMSIGKPVIVPNIVPYNELIYDKFNGFLIDGPDDIQNAIKQLKRNRKLISENAKYTTLGRSNPRIISQKLLNGSFTDGIRHSLFNKDKWIIRQRFFQNGETLFFPEEFHGDFKESDHHDLLSILEFFSIKDFDEVFIFGVELNSYDINEFYRIKSLMSTLKHKLLKLHFCMDDKIEDKWHDMFKKVSIISIEEGLKQVKK